MLAGIRAAVCRCRATACALALALCWSKGAAGEAGTPRQVGVVIVSPTWVADEAVLARALDRVEQASGDPVVELYALATPGLVKLGSSADPLPLLLAPLHGGAALGDQARLYDELAALDEEELVVVLAEPPPGASGEPAAVVQAPPDGWSEPVLWLVHDPPRSPVVFAFPKAAGLKPFFETANAGPSRTTQLVGGAVSLLGTALALGIVVPVVGAMSLVAGAVLFRRRRRLLRRARSARGDGSDPVVMSVAWEPVRGPGSVVDQPLQLPSRDGMSSVRLVDKPRRSSDVRLPGLPASLRLFYREGAVFAALEGLDEEVPIAVGTALQVTGGQLVFGPPWG